MICPEPIIAVFFTQEQDEEKLKRNYEEKKESARNIFSGNSQAEMLYTQDIMLS